MPITNASLDLVHPKMLYCTLCALALSYWSQALGEYNWDVHRHYHGNLTYLTSTHQHPMPRLLAYHPDLLQRLRPQTMSDILSMVLQLVKVGEDHTLFGCWLVLAGGTKAHSLLFSCAPPPPSAHCHPSGCCCTGSHSGHAGCALLQSSCVMHPRPSGPHGAPQRHLPLRRTQQIPQLWHPL